MRLGFKIKLYYLDLKFNNETKMKHTIMRLGFNIKSQ